MNFYNSELCKFLNLYSVMVFLIILPLFPSIGTYRPTLVCIDGSNSNSDSSGIYEVTPNGKHIDNDGQVSIGILYFYVILGLGLVFLGFLFLKMILYGLLILDCL